MPLSRPARSAPRWETERRNGGAGASIPRMRRNRGSPRCGLRARSSARAGCASSASPSSLACRCPVCGGPAGALGVVFERVPAHEQDVPLRLLYAALQFVGEVALRGGYDLRGFGEGLLELVRPVG